MKKLVTVTVVLCVVIVLSACGITIVPRPVSPSDLVNSSDHSITILRNQLSLTARVQDTAVGGYSFEKPITSFYVVAVNKASSPVTLPLTSFTLVDDRGTIYQAVSPEEVNALFLPEFDYLVPFPYVSFLDVVDLESQKASSAMQSEQPYVGRPLEGVAIDAPFTPAIKPGARGAGAIFFEVDLYNLKTVKLQIEDPAGKSPFVFPFSIEK